MDEWVRFERLIIEGLRDSCPHISAMASRLYVGAYANPLQRRLQGFALDDAIAEDLSQDALYTAHGKLASGQFTPDGLRSSWPWLLGIGRNKLKTWRRGRAREYERVRMWMTLPAELTVTPEDRAVRKDSLLRGIQRLPQAQRAAIDKLLVRRLYGADERDSLRSNLSKALKNLTQILNEEESSDVQQAK
jgi:hypothetical protein